MAAATEMFSEFFFCVKRRKKLCFISNLWNSFSMTDPRSAAPYCAGTVAMPCLEWRFANGKREKNYSFVLYIPLCESDVWMGQWTSRKVFIFIFYFFFLMNCLQKFKDKNLTMKKKMNIIIIWFDTFVKPNPKIKHGTRLPV